MNKYKTNFISAVSLILILLITSCSKDNSVPTQVGSTVRLNIGQAFADTGAKKNTVKASSSGYGIASIQKKEISLHQKYQLVATLTAINTVPLGIKASTSSANTVAGSEQRALKEGTVYHVAIFDATGHYQETKSFTKGKGEQDFSIEKGKYTFVIYASGTNKSLPTIDKEATLNTVNFVDLKADQDFMLDQVPFEVKEGQNMLSTDLKHLFSQITFDLTTKWTGAEELISGMELEDIALNGASIDPVSAAVDVALGNGLLTFKGVGNPVAIGLKNTIGKIIYSESAFIITAPTTNGTILLSGFSFAGLPPEDLSIGGWNLRPGVKYQLNITLKMRVEAA
ncbi:MAG: hypothetical protein ACN6PN_08330 [Sphingobacterium sp.]